MEDFLNFHLHRNIPVLAVGISVYHALFGALRCQILFIVAENLRKKTCCCGSKSLFGCLKSPCFMFPPHPKWFAVDLRPSWNCTSPCRACNSWLPPRLPPRDWKRLPSNYWNNLTIGVSILYYSIIVNKYPMIQIFGNNYWNTINNLYHCIRMNSGYNIEPYAKPRCQNMFCSSAHGEFPSKKKNPEEF